MIFAEKSIGQGHRLQRAGRQDQGREPRTWSTTAAPTSTGLACSPKQMSDSGVKAAMMGGDSLFDTQYVELAGAEAARG